MAAVSAISHHSTSVGWGFPQPRDVAVLWESGLSMETFARKYRVVPTSCTWFSDDDGDRMVGNILLLTNRVVHTYRSVNHITIIHAHGVSKVKFAVAFPLSCCKKRLKLLRVLMHMGSLESNQEGAGTLLLTLLSCSPNLRLPDHAPAFNHHLLRVKYDFDCTLPLTRDLACESASKTLTGRIKPAH